MCFIFELLVNVLLFRKLCLGILAFQVFVLIFKAVQVNKENCTSQYATFGIQCIQPMLNKCEVLTADIKADKKQNVPVY